MSKPETKWTPGPWLVAGNNLPECMLIETDEADFVAMTMTPKGVASLDAVANALLIAAAPDLYEALQVAADLCVGTFAENGTPHKQMLAALAKARGE